MSPSQRQHTGSGSIINDDSKYCTRVFALWFALRIWSSQTCNYPFPPHDVAILALHWRHTAGQRVRKMFILLLPRMSTHSTSLYRCNSDSAANFPSCDELMPTCPHEHHWREMMSCIAIAREGFTLNYISLELYSQFMCTQEKDKKNTTKIVFLFTIRKGSCDFIKGGREEKKMGDKHKGTVSSPQVFSGIFSSYTV